MKIYLAARYSRHPELQGYAAELEQFGHQITSRWIQGAHQISDDGLSAEESAEERRRFAMEDWADLEAADLVISFTEKPRSKKSASRGGRHVEFGAALAMGKYVWVCGPRENVFHCLDRVIHFETWDGCRQAAGNPLVVESVAAVQRAFRPLSAAFAAMGKISNATAADPH